MTLDISQVAVSCLVVTSKGAKQLPALYEMVSPWFSKRTNSSKSLSSHLPDSLFES